MAARFRQFVYPQHPLLAGLDKLTPLEYADVMRRTPIRRDAINRWMELFETTSFKGITSDGNIICASSTSRRRNLRWFWP
ncbi:hypothetical protein [Mycobacterium sp. 1465703.0]|uniref:hypothetical protein n=1 Tax=Mycobacterium sp. 1465703.0 TaxID=1834078 RepID=UPI0007FFBEB9|nr:hypothetical protein [Mycobacterium sp. 1465703.0]OBJ10575.1 hypothetical protein A5625_11065 [Mycobacterium sp. 1465703.0]